MKQKESDGMPLFLWVDNHRQKLLHPPIDVWDAHAQEQHALGMNPTKYVRVGSNVVDERTQRDMQIELIRLHFAIQWRDNFPNYEPENLLKWAWEDADAFIKKSEA